MNQSVAFSFLDPFLLQVFLTRRVDLTTPVLLTLHVVYYQTGPTVAVLIITQCAAVMASTAAQRGELIKLD